MASYMVKLQSISAWLNICQAFMDYVSGSNNIIIIYVTIAASYIHVDYIECQDIFLGSQYQYNFSET